MKRWSPKMLTELMLGFSPELKNYLAPSVQRAPKKKRSKLTPNTPRRVIYPRYPIRKGSVKYQHIVNGTAVERTAPLVTCMDGRQYAARPDGWRRIGYAQVKR